MSCTHKIYSEELLIRINNLIPHSLNLQCKLNGFRWLRNKMFRSVDFGVMALTILKQILLNFNTFNHFKVVKCLQITKTKHLRKVKQIKNGYFLHSFLWLFRKGGVGTIRQKANARSRYHADRSNSNIEWRTHLSNHSLNGISLHFVGFELFKKALLVALGIWFKYISLTLHRKKSDET